MRDLEIKGTGNSRNLKSAIPEGTTWEQAIQMLRGGTFPIDLLGLNSDGVVDMSASAYSKGNVAPDSICNVLGIDTVESEPKDIFNALLTKRHDAYAAFCGNINKEHVEAAMGKGCENLCTNVCLQTAQYVWSRLGVDQTQHPLSNFKKLPDYSKIPDNPSAKTEMVNCPELMEWLSGYDYPGNVIYNASFSGNNVLEIVPISQAQIRVSSYTTYATITVSKKGFYKVVSRWVAFSGYTGGANMRILKNSDEVIFEDTNSSLWGGWFGTENYFETGDKLELQIKMDVERDGYTLDIEDVRIFFALMSSYYGKGVQTDSTSSGAFNKNVVGFFSDKESDLSFVDNVAVSGSTKQIDFIVEESGYYLPTFFYKLYAQRKYGHTTCVISIDDNTMATITNEEVNTIIGSQDADSKIYLEKGNHTLKMVYTYSRNIDYHAFALHTMMLKNSYGYVTVI